MILNPSNSTRPKELITRTKFNDAKGKLTVYAFACGYRETTTVENSLCGTVYYITLEQEAGCKVFTVKIYEKTTRVQYLTFPSATKARAYIVAKTLALTTELEQA